MSRDDTSSQKVCFKCGEAKPRNEFYKHSAMADGLLGKCKACTRADVSANRAANIDRVREYDRRRASQPHRAKMAKELQSLRRKADKRKDYCHGKVLRAIKSGALERLPCEVCGDKRSHAHHESYEHPLDVRWLCAVHHAERHRQMAIDGIEP